MFKFIQSLVPKEESQVNNGRVRLLLLLLKQQLANFPQIENSFVCFSWKRA